MIHPEHKIENSLTCPLDRNPDRSYKPNQGGRNLSEEEVGIAMKSLNNRSYVQQFLRVERRYADPIEPLQRIGLFSFVPAKGSTPNKNGVYGFAKLRGNYATDREASERAEYLIRNVDSYHQLYHTYVGRPFPLTVSSDYSGETTEIDIRKSMTESMSESVKAKRREEKKKIQEIKDREKELLSESKKDEEDPIDNYTTLRVKKAQLIWTYLETEKKLEEMKNIIIKTRDELSDMDSEHPEFADNYFQKYKEARDFAGLNNSNNQNTFMKYLVEDYKFDWL